MINPLINKASVGTDQKRNVDGFQQSMVVFCLRQKARNLLFSRLKIVNALPEHTKRVHWKILTELVPEGHEFDAQFFPWHLRESLSVLTGIADREITLILFSSSVASARTRSSSWQCLKEGKCKIWRS